MEASADPNPDDDLHRKWKQSAAPIYDWMTNNHLVWPGLACRFGSREQIPDDNSKYKQTIYFSEQVAKDEDVPNKLIYQVVNVPEENFTPIDNINKWKEDQKSPYFSKSERKVINHPGECNKIREVYNCPNVVVTHSDVEDVYVWDFNAHTDPSATGKVTKASKQTEKAPDLRLTGHSKQACFALASSTLSPSIASGGDDCNLLVWNLTDVLSSGSGGATTLTNLRLRSETLRFRTRLSGHTNTIGDVCFKPGTDALLASVADDHMVKVWDTRSGQESCSLVYGSEDDLMAIDWSGDGLHLAVTDDEGAVRVHDIRRLDPAAPLFRFPRNVQHKSSMVTVAWNPNRHSYFCCGGDDGRVTVYDISRPTTDTHDGLPAQLVLQHLGHLGNIMDSQWSPSDPFTLMSISNDGETYKEGGAVQLWRLSWMLHEDVDVAESKLKEYQTWLESGKLVDIGNLTLPRKRSAPPSSTPEAPSTDTTSQHKSAAAKPSVATSAAPSPKAPLQPAGAPPQAAAPAAADAVVASADVSAPPEQAAVNSFAPDAAPPTAAPVEAAGAASVHKEDPDAAAATSLGQNAGTDVEMAAPAEEAVGGGTADTLPSAPVDASAAMDTEPVEPQAPNAGMEPTEAG